MITIMSIGRLPACVRDEVAEAISVEKRMKVLPIDDYALCTILNERRIYD